jgi:hypothetical protein
MSEVISFTSRKPVEQDAAELAAFQEQQAVAHAQALSEAQESILKGLDEVKALVLAGRLEGLVLVGRDPTTDLFHSQILLPLATVPRQKLFGYMGMLDCLKIELSDNALLAPSVMEDGSILDPYLEEVGEEWPE